MEYPDNSHITTPVLDKLSFYLGLLASFLITLLSGFCVAYRVVSLPFLGNNPSDTHPESEPAH